MSVPNHFRNPRIQTPGLDNQIGAVRPQGFSFSGAVGAYGFLTASSPAWTVTAVGGCSIRRRIYCFEQ